MKLFVTFSRGKGRKPIIAQVVRDTGVLINVERAVIDSSEGEALIDVPDDQCRLVSDTMTSLGAHVRILEHGVGFNESECVDCGACISICPREVFSFDPDWKLSLDEKKCVLCGKCVWTCRERLGIGTIGFAQRGFQRVVTTFANSPIAESGCQACGECVKACPVGALAFKDKKPRR